MLDQLRYHPTASEDPVTQDLEACNKARVFTTNSVLSLLRTLDLRHGSHEGFMDPKLDWQARKRKKSICVLDIYLKLTKWYCVVWSDFKPSPSSNISHPRFEILHTKEYPILFSRLSMWTVDFNRYRIVTPWFFWVRLLKSKWIWINHLHCFYLTLMSWTVALEKVAKRDWITFWYILEVWLTLPRLTSARVLSISIIIHQHWILMILNLFIYIASSHPTTWNLDKASYLKNPRQKKEILLEDKMPSLMMALCTNLRPSR